VAATAPKTQFPQNIVAIDANGSLRVLDNQRRFLNPLDARDALVKNPVPKKASQTQAYTQASSDHAASFFGTIPSSTPHQRVSFHSGGLNNLRDGVTRANKLTRHIMDDPNPVAGAYPIFVAWNANLISAWFEQYSTHRGQTDPVFGYILAPLTWPGTSVECCRDSRCLFLNRATLECARCVRQCTAAERTRLFFMPRPERVNRQYEALQKEGTPSSWTQELAPALFAPAECDAGRSRPESLIGRGC